MSLDPKQCSTIVIALDVETLDKKFINFNSGKIVFETDQSLASKLPSYDAFMDCVKLIDNLDYEIRLAYDFFECHLVDDKYHVVNKFRGGSWSIENSTTINGKLTAVIGWYYNSAIVDNYEDEHANFVISRALIRRIPDIVYEDYDRVPEFELDMIVEAVEAYPAKDQELEDVLQSMQSYYMEHYDDEEFIDGPPDVIDKADIKVILEIRYDISSDLVEAQVCDGLTRVICLKHGRLKTVGFHNHGKTNFMRIGYSSEEEAVLARDKLLSHDSMQHCNLQIDLIIV